MGLGKKITVFGGLFCLLEQFIPTGDTGRIKFHVPVIVNGKAILAGDLRHSTKPNYRSLYRIEIDGGVNFQINTTTRSGGLGKCAVKRSFKDNKSPGGTRFPQTPNQQRSTFVFQLAYQRSIVTYVFEYRFVFGQGAFDRTRQIISHALAGSDNISHMQGNISFIDSEIFFHILTYRLLRGRQEIEDVKQRHQNNKQE